MLKELPLKDIMLLDNATKQRPLDDDVVARYAALIKDGVKFKPVDIVNDGKENYLWDGRHRYHAYRKLDKKYIPCSVEPGSLRDAIFFSFHANHDHGLPRQPGVAKDIILIILADSEWGKMPVKEIAEWVGVTRRHVEKIIAEKKEAEQKKDAGKNEANVKMGKNFDANSSQDNVDSKPENEENEVNINLDKSPVLLDSVGEIVPEKFIPIFARINEIKTYIHQLNQMLKTIKDARANNDLLWSHCKINPLEVEVKNVTRNLRFSLPYTVCCYCRGDGKNCRACGELGWVNEQSYLCTAAELKKQKQIDEEKTE
jgi:hypothetical protein